MRTGALDPRRAVGRDRSVDGHRVPAGGRLRSYERRRARRALELQAGLRAQRGEDVGVHPRRPRRRLCELLDRVDADGSQPLALHRAHTGHEEQITGCHDLRIARRTASARDDAELAARVSPRDRLPRRSEFEAPVGDQRGQPLAPQPEDGEEIVDLMLADAAVAEEQLHAVRAGHAQPVELVDVGRELHEGGDTGVACELRVLHDPRPVRSRGPRLGP